MVCVMKWTSNGQLLRIKYNSLGVCVCAYASSLSILLFQINDDDQLEKWGDALYRLLFSFVFSFHLLFVIFVVINMRMRYQMPCSK